MGQYAQQIGLNNTRSYRTYKVSFNSVKTNSASMMQIGEVELLGLAVPSLALSGGATPGTLTLRSSVPGRLWSTSALQGTNTVWRDEGPITGSVIITPSVSEPARLYRVSVP
ncbi:MAG TPA: hypothetical protein VNZ22_13090 [Bacillota bacterium]|nr:hypothetical protein [Bacillota bacterium]